MDPETVGPWISAVKAERATVAARLAAGRLGASADRPLSEAEISEMVSALGDMRIVIQQAAAPEKAKAYKELGLKLDDVPSGGVARGV